MTATITAARAHLRELRRRHTTVVLLLVLPPTVIITYGAAMSSFPTVGGLPQEPATAGRVLGAIFAAAFLAGLVGLFQAIEARGTDGRLLVAGFPPMALLGSRILTTISIAAVSALLSLGVVSLGVNVAAPGAAALALLGAGLIYGLLGALVGTLLPRDLEGSLVLVFLADADTALSSGLFATGRGVAAWFPLSHPIDAFEAAVYEGTLATNELAVTAGYAAGIAIILAITTQMGGVDA